MELTQSFVAISLAAFVVFIGFPVWWQTTKVYRANLPFREIAMLAENKSDLHIKLTFDIFVDEMLLQEASTIPQSFKKVLSPMIKEGLPRFDVRIIYNILPTDVWLDVAVNGTGSDLRSCIDILCRSTENKLKHTSLNNARFHQNLIFMKRIGHFLDGKTSKERLLLFCSSSLIISMECLEQGILRNTTKWIVSNMQRILFPSLNGDTSNEGQNTSKTPLHSSSGIDIAFTLANANPFEAIIDWNVEDAIHSKLMPFLQMISEFGPFFVTSQILNFVNVGLEPKKQKNGGYFYPIKKLPLLINPLESRLKGYTSNNPILNFILYVPQAKHMPLMIRNKGATYMSFTSPRWGGVLIKNLEQKNLQKNGTAMKQKLDVNYLEVQSDMKIFVSQLRELIGLERKTIDDVFFASVDRTAVANWEINLLLLQGTVTNLEQSTSILKSLAALLGKIANIVIRDDIKERIDGAIYNITRSRSFLGKGQLKGAFISSKSALMSCERAFYDHSLLALLYFPDDQKYAIYLPLFLPVAVPLLLSVFYGIKTVFKHFKTS